MKLYPVRFSVKTYSAEFQTHEDYSASWQRTLGRYHDQHEVGHCQCAGRGDRPICIRQRGDRFFLARYADTGPQHATDCQYFSSGLDAGPVDEAGSGQAHADLAEERVQLAVGMHIMAPANGADRVDLRGRRRRQQSSAGAMRGLVWLQDLLWERAGLNEWKPEWAGRRSAFTINRRLRQGAAAVMVNGVDLSRHLLVGAVEADEQGIAHNNAVTASVQGKGLRLLVLARMARARENEQMGRLRLANFSGIPAIYVSAGAAEEAERKFPVELAAWRAGEGTMVLAQIEPVVGRPFWRAVALAFSMVTCNYVQVSRTAPA